MPNSIPTTIDSELKRFIALLDEQHKRRVEEAKHLGEDLGSTSQPPENQEHPPPEEKLFEAQYQTMLSEVGLRFAPEIESFHIDHRSLKETLNRPEVVWEKESADRVETADQNAKVKKETAEQDAKVKKEAAEQDAKVKRETAEQKANDKKDRALKHHNGKLRILDDFIDNQIQTPYNNALGRLREARRKAGRHYLDVWLESRWVYFTFLALIGLAEFPINNVIFVVFRETVFLTMLMSGTLVLGVPIAAHFAGLALKRRKHEGQQRANWVIGVGVTILILALSISAGILRVYHLQDVDPNSDQGKLATVASGELFIVLSVLMYAIAGLLSYGHHDEDREFEAAYWAHDHAKAEFDKEKLKKESERETLLSSYQTGLTEIDNERNDIFTEANKEQSITITDASKELSEERKAIGNAKSRVKAQMLEKERQYDSVLKLLKPAESRIFSHYNEVIRTFQSANSKARRTEGGNANPKYFEHDPAPLKMHFHSYAELAPNPAEGPVNCPNCGHEFE